MASTNFANKVRTSFKSGSVSNTNFRKAIKESRVSNLIQAAALELQKLSTSEMTKGSPQVVDLLKIKVKNGVKVVSELIDIYKAYVKKFSGQRVNLGDFNKSVEKYEQKREAVQNALRSNVPADVFTSSSKFADESLKVQEQGRSAVERATKSRAKGDEEQSAAAFNAAYVPAVAQAEAVVNAAAQVEVANQAALNGAAAEAAQTAANANAQAAQAAAEAAAAAQNARNNAPELNTVYNTKPVVSQNEPAASKYPLLLTNRSPANAAEAKAAQNAANAAAANAAAAAVAAQTANANSAAAAEVAAANSAAKANVLARIAKARAEARIAKARAEARPPPGPPPSLEAAAQARRGAAARIIMAKRAQAQAEAEANASRSRNNSSLNNGSVGNASVGNGSMTNGSVGNPSLENNTEFKQMNASNNSGMQAVGLLNGYTNTRKNELNVLSNKISANLMRMTNDSVTLRKKANDIKERLSRLNKSIIASGKTLMGNERAAMMARVMAILRQLDGKVQALNSTTPGLRDELVDIETTLAQLEAQYPSTKQDGGRRTRKQKQKKQNKSRKQTRQTRQRK